MQYNIYQSVQTVEEWQYTIKKKFLDVSIQKPQEIADILAITDIEEIQKIQQALLENYAEKYGLKDIEFKRLHESVPKKFQVEYKLEQIIDVIRGAWKPNWQDTNQKKWYPYFNMHTKSCPGCHYSWNGSSSAFVSRLCLETEEQAWFMGNYYLQDYITYLND